MGHNEIGAIIATNWVTVCERDNDIRASEESVCMTKNHQ